MEAHRPSRQLATLRAGHAWATLLVHSIAAASVQTMETWWVHDSVAPVALPAATATALEAALEVARLAKMRTAVKLAMARNLARTAGTPSGVATSTVRFASQASKGTTWASTVVRASAEASSSRHRPRKATRARLLARV